MGIARFYRYLSERYPLINQRIDVEELPEFDILYLDMNGIIHQCAHGNSGGFQHDDEDSMWVSIFEYINRLFMLIKPRKLLYMAVDGVAPRAKMNQQRSRRFRSAEDARQGLIDAERHGVASTKQRFDTNCITPGTEFMSRLTEHLKFFIAMKMNDDPMWKRCQIILSGPEVPGEGEHKIMDFIRTRKAQPDYDPNLRHCLYGLDADLIMLALASHEPNFSLLREEVKFGRNQVEGVEDRLLVSREKFQLLHICLVREYLDLEFRDHAKDRHYRFDLERVIDDFILFCFLVGNDFLPHLPMAEIGSNGLGILYEGYKSHLEHCEALEPWLSHNCGEILWPRLREFFSTLVEEENCVLQETIDRGDYILGARRMVGQADDDEQETASEATISEPVSTVEEARRYYYQVKMDLDINEEEGRKGRDTLMQKYCEGMQWVLWYYYRGPQMASWKWYFPYYHTPFIFDLCYFSDFEHPVLDLPQGGPVFAFEQLMSVLPAASSDLVPKCYRKLFHDADSSVRQFYPKQFAIDVDGVRVPWGGVTLIPFIQPELLRQALDEVEASNPLTEEEQKRNSRSEAFIFEHDADHQHTFASTLSRFQSIDANVRIREFKHPEFPPGVTMFPHSVPAGWVKTDDLPTLFQFGGTPEVHLGRGVSVFGSTSRNDSLYITIRPSLPITDVDNALQNAPIVSVDFPARAQAGKVVRVLTHIDNPTHFDDVHNMLWDYRLNGLLVECGTRVRNDIPLRMPLCEVQLVKEPYLNDTGEVQYSLRGKTELRLLPLVTPIGSRRKLERRDVDESTLAMCLENCNARGLMGNIVKTEPLTARFMVEKNLDVQKMNADLVKLSRTEKKRLKWFTIQELAEQAKIPEGVANHLVGSVWWKTPESSKEDIGMNFKYRNANGDSMCCVNYSALIANVGWKFSSMAVEAVADYVRNFPRLVNVLKNHNPSRDVLTRHFFPEDPAGNSFRLLRYIKAQPYKTMKLVPARYMALGKDAVDVIRNEVDKRLAKREEVEVLSTEVYVPSLRGLFPNKEKTELAVGMRICYTKQGGPVPFGTPGTIIGLYDGERPMCDMLLDKEYFGATTCQNRCPTHRGLTCDQCDVLLLGIPAPVSPGASSRATASSKVRQPSKKDLAIKQETDGRQDKKESNRQDTDRRQDKKESKQETDVRQSRKKENKHEDGRQAEKKESNKQETDGRQAEKKESNKQDTDVWLSRKTKQEPDGRQQDKKDTDGRPHAKKELNKIGKREKKDSPGSSHREIGKLSPGSDTRHISSPSSGKGPHASSPSSYTAGITIARPPESECKTSAPRPPDGSDHPRELAHGPWQRKATNGGSEIMALLHANAEASTSSGPGGGPHRILEILQRPSPREVTSFSSGDPLPRAQFAESLPGEKQGWNAQEDAQVTRADKEIRIFNGRETHSQMNGSPMARSSEWAENICDFAPKPFDVPLPGFVKRSLAAKQAQCDRLQ